MAGPTMRSMCEHGIAIGTRLNIAQHCVTLSPDSELNQIYFSVSSQFMVVTAVLEPSLMAASSLFVTNLFSLIPFVQFVASCLFNMRAKDHLLLPTCFGFRYDILAFYQHLLVHIK